MKTTFAILAVASVNAACECLMTEENGLPSPSFFTEAGYPADYGSMCTAWDIEGAYCLEGGDNFGESWCTNAWCYVASDNTCDPAAMTTTFFADTEYDGLMWAESACSEDSSMALYASAMAATVAVIAASI